MVSKGRLPKNAINSALRELDPTHYEIVEIHNGHRWGVVRCLTCKAEIAIWSTPRVPEHVAENIRRFAAKHQSH